MRKGTFIAASTGKLPSGSPKQRFPITSIRCFYIEMFNFSRMRWHLPLGDYKQQIMQELPLIAVEDSILLRVLVLVLVVRGMAATDIAAETRLSFWAVPLSGVGAIWSYYRRRGSNVSVKFCIAIEMLVALGAFFGRLVGAFNSYQLSVISYQ